MQPVIFWFDSPASRFTRYASRSLSWSVFLLFGWNLTADADPPRFVDVTESSGIDFRHIHGGTGERYFVETVGSGCAFLDYDNDGWLDIFAVDGGVLPGYEGKLPRNRLYRNQGDGTFSDVTSSAGVAVTDYGMGCCVGDYDNDGYDDIYVTCYGINSLFRNNGDGTFRDVARLAGVAGDFAWGVGCAFLDYDNDGNLDLYVANYVDYSVFAAYDNLLPYGVPSSSVPTDTKFYPHPGIFPGDFDRLYHNNGDGTFTDVTKSAGVLSPLGRGMGLVCTDYDNDGDVDIYVANDTVADYFYRNRGDGTFEDIALLAGLAYNVEGYPMASMGADFGDYDGDGWQDLVVTHFQWEGVGLYRNEGNGMFSDVSSASGLDRPTYPYVHWGVNFLDYDNDSWPDVYIVNGHALHNANLFGSSYPQPSLLFRNSGKGKYTEVSETSGKALSVPRVSRGATFGDYDNDGDVDIFINNNNSPATLLRNEGGNQNHWLTVKLVGGARGQGEGIGGQGSGVGGQGLEVGGGGGSEIRPPSSESRLSNRSGIGGRVTLWADGQKQVKEVRSGSSYMSHTDFRLHFGIGSVVEVDSLLIRWPSGLVERFESVQADRFLTVREGEAGEESAK